MPPPPKYLIQVSLNDPEWLKREFRADQFGYHTPTFQYVHTPLAHVTINVGTFVLIQT
ncbi:MAG: hypothetical protein NZZ41_07465 [Candidatus Dojkabacteria bacterium]|nr:hypothetical protein [Candidatus Dojkabacteria bacterium]